MTEQSQKFEQWCIVEIMGHQRLAGFVTEQTIGGAAMVRVDVPECDGMRAFTKFYGAAAIYAITPCTEETARHAVRHFRQRPISEFELPTRALPAPDATELRRRPDEELDEEDDDETEVEDLADLEPARRGDDVDLDDDEPGYDDELGEGD